MTYEEALHFHVREFDRQVDDLRSIMLQPNYDNGEAPEVVRLRRDIMQIVTQTFLLKQTHSRATDFKQKQEKP